MYLYSLTYNNNYAFNQRQSFAFYGKEDTIFGSTLENKNFYEL